MEYNATLKKDEEDLCELIKTFQIYIVKGKKAKCKRVSIACYSSCKKKGEIRKHLFLLKETYKSINQKLMGLTSYGRK